MARELGSSMLDPRCTHGRELLAATGYSLGFLLIQFRNCKIDRGSFARLGIQSDHAFVIFNDAAHQSEAHAGAGDLAAVWRPLKQIEGFLLKSRVHAHAVVAHPKSVEAWLLLPTDLNA